METIRYAREELLQWQYEAVEAGCWEAMVASMGAPLYQELCSLSQLPDHQIHVSANLQRNINKHHRPPVSTINPLSKFLERGAFDFDIDLGFEHLWGGGEGGHHICGAQNNLQGVLCLLFMKGREREMMM